FSRDWSSDVCSSDLAGLWGYSIGDTVKFVSKNPYRIVVTGRIKHYISAFGEHVISEEVDAAIQKACSETGAELFEYHVAPQVQRSEERRVGKECRSL